MPRKIFIFDTTLRDGEQSPGASLNSTEKMEIARQLAKLNVDIIEAGFPISSQEDFEAVSAIAQKIKGPTICALARAKDEDIIRAGEALEYAEKPMLHTFIGTSNLQVKDVLKKTHDEVLEMVVKAVRLAKSFYPDVEFSAMDASRTDYDYLTEIVAAAIEAGATVINIPDTAGYAIPNEFGGLINKLFLTVPELRQGVGVVRLSVHCHDDLGNAAANSIEAIQSGATQIECAINGMGERAGNAALEEVVMTIKTRGDYLDAYTDVKNQEIINTSRLVSRLSGFVVPPNKPIVGANAFAHSSGIHQDGVLKERSTFEIMLPQDVGLSESEIVLTARSGRHALQHRLSLLGYELAKEQLEVVYKRFLELADKKKLITNADLEAIAEVVIRGIGELSITSVISTPDVDGVFRATMVLQKGEGKTIEWKGEAGDGPVDAIFKAVCNGTNTKFKLVRYNVEASDEGSDSPAKATVEVRYDGHKIEGLGFHTNTLQASAEAFLSAVTKAMEAKLGEGYSVESDFSPQMIEKPSALFTGKMYFFPECPMNYIRLVGVGGGEIAIFKAKKGSWQGGHYKSGKWLFFNTATEADAVCFPTYKRGETSDDHRYGGPDFYKGGVRMDNMDVVEELEKQE